MNQIFALFLFPTTLIIIIAIMTLHVYLVFL